MEILDGNGTQGMNLTGLKTGSILSKGLQPAKEQSVGETLNSFGEMLTSQIDKLNQLQAEANTAVETYAVGGQIEPHNVILAVEKADMALQMAVQVRNKMVQAYQELSRMQV